MTTIPSVIPQAPLPSYREGDRFGDYRILRRIGAGGMASVWLARHLPLNRLVALKILRSEFALDERNVRRFVQEAQSAARLMNPAIVHIYEVGTLGGTSPVRFLRPLFGGPKSPIHFIAEEYVPGMNLGLYVRRHGPLSPFQTLSVIGQVASALQCAADSGIVHRDIKPENILLGETGGVKVADFGLAFCQTSDGATDLSLTRVGITLGTPLYMSPEQAEGKKLDIRSDLYSLGVTAFWMLTGRPPFSGGTPMAVLLQHINAPLPDLKALRPDVPVEVAELITCLMAKNPTERFATPKLLKETVQKIQKGLSEPLVGKLDGLAESDSDAPSETFFWGSPNEEIEFTRALNALETTRQLQTTLNRLDVANDSPKSRRRLGGTLAAAGLALLAGSGWAYYQTRLPNIPLSIRRLDSVEEQWVFAAQLGTSDAWQSVIDFFPDNPYWVDKACRQRAFALMSEGQTDAARHLFDEFAMGNGAGRTNLSFGMAGRAWILATEGKSDEASALLSELRSGSVGSFDRLTEEILSKTGEIIRGGGERH